jgi:predicted site-specific integrase-resolvase
MENILRVREVAEQLGVSHDTVTRWIKVGKINALPRTIFDGETSPIFISVKEFQRVQKLLKARAGSSKTAG